MSDQEIRDRTGRLLGKIRQISGGRLEGRDSLGRLKGTYDPRTNQTRDSIGRLVANGNVLSNVILNGH
jgi:hypothetical protein